MNAKTQKQQFSVDGMTCTSCEVLIERKLKKLSGVVSVSVSHTTQTCLIEHRRNGTISAEEVQTVLSDTKYRIASEKNIFSAGAKEWQSSQKKWPRLLFVLLLFLLGMYLYRKLQTMSLFDVSFSLEQSVSYGMAFIFGLIASISTCMAVVGGLILALSAETAEESVHKTLWQRLRLHVFFQSGRLISYFFLGGIAGVIGSVITFSTGMASWLTIAVSVLMLLMALDLLKIFPGGKYVPKIPKRFSHMIHNLAENPKPHTPLLLGALTFFLPCGFTQSMQLFALSSGSFVRGALVLFYFALGTLPALLGIGLVSSLVRGKAAKFFFTASGIVILVLAVSNISASLNVLGLNPKIFLSSLSNNDQQAVAVSGSVQKVYMKVQGIDYVPNILTVQAGVPVEWHVDGTKASGCTSVLVIPSLRISQNIAGKKDAVIRFTPKKTGVLPFTCSMGMASGQFQVVAPAKQEKCDSSVQSCL